MKEKINPVPCKIHPKFKDVLVLIQTARIKNGKETAQTKVALWKLTKAISNMLEVNQELLNKLIEVDINAKY